MDNIVKNDSNGYGYKYASLSDIAKQGFKIPKMKTGTEEGKQYVYWFDEELKEWFRGAEIVIPTNKGMNEAQLYGSALTYARRYTVQMADCLATDDDKEIETKAPPKKESIFDEPIVTDMSMSDAVKEMKKLYSTEEQVRIMNNDKVTRLEDLGLVKLNKYINYRKYGEPNPKK